MKKALLIAAVGLAWSLVAMAGGTEAGQTPGGLRYSITVSKFENKSGWRGQWEVGDAFGAILTDALQTSAKFIVLGEKDMRQEAMAEQDLGASGRTAGGAKTPKVGQMTPAQLLVKGDVTHVQNDTAGGGGGVSFMGVSVGGKGGKGEVNITIYVIDSTTGQVKASTKVVGVSTKKGLSVGYSGSALGGLGIGADGFKNDNVGKACENAVAQAVEFLVKQLDSIPWTGTVVKGGDKVLVNRGTREGVAVGMEFEVGASEEVRDPDSGELLDNDFKKAGTIRVTEVKEKIAYCEVLDGKGFAKGMTIRPVQ